MNVCFVCLLYTPEKHVPGNVRILERLSCPCWNLPETVNDERSLDEDLDDSESIADQVKYFYLL